MPKTKIRFEDLEQGLTAPIAITSNIVNAVSIDGNTFSVDALNNRIGIGTTAPAHALDVRNGNIYAHNGSFLLSAFNAIGGSQYFGKEYLGGIIAGMEIENTTLGGNYSQKLHFRTHRFAVFEGRAMTIGESGNVGIGTASPNANALLDVSSTTKAFMPPRMTTTQKNAIGSPTAGMVIYDTTLNKLCVYTTAWETITSV